MTLFILRTFYADHGGRRLRRRDHLRRPRLSCPPSATPQVVETTISWNYTTYLNIVFLALAGALLVRFVRTGGMPMLAHDGRRARFRRTRARRPPRFDAAVEPSSNTFENRRPWPPHSRQQRPGADVRIRAVLAAWVDEIELAYSGSRSTHLWRSPVQGICWRPTQTPGAVTTSCSRPDSSSRHVVVSGCSGGVARPGGLGSSSAVSSSGPRVDGQGSHASARTSRAGPCVRAAGTHGGHS